MKTIIYRNNKPKQAGFTLIELMIVVVVLSILATWSMNGYNSWVNATKIDTATYFIERDFLSAATQCYRMNRAYSPCDKTELTKHGLTDETSWGTQWSSSVTGQVFSLSLPVPDAETGNTLATRLSASNLKHIQSASYSGSAVTVSMRMP